MRSRGELFLSQGWLLEAVAVRQKIADFPAEGGGKRKYGADRENDRPKENGNQNEEGLIPITSQSATAGFDRSWESLDGWKRNLHVVLGFPGVGRLFLRLCFTYFQKEKPPGIAIWLKKRKDSFARSLSTARPARY